MYGFARERMLITPHSQGANWMSTQLRSQQWLFANNFNASLSFLGSKHYLDRHILNDGETTESYGKPKSNQLFLALAGKVNVK